MDTASGLGTLEQSIRSALVTYSLIYILSSIIGLIILYLIVRAAVQSGTMAALVDAGLVKKGSPWAQRYYAHQAQSVVEAVDSWRSSSPDHSVEIDESDDPFSTAD